MSLNNFSFSQGGNKLSDIKDYINNSIVPDSINPSITGSLSVTGSINFNTVQLVPLVGALPTAAPTGSLFVSGSGTAYKLYVWNGSAFFTSSMSQI